MFIDIMTIVIRECHGLPVTTSDYLLIVDSRFGRFKRFWLSLIKNSNYSLVCLNRFENDLTK